MLRTVDLFCGCGGMSLGFQNAGFNVVAAFDNWDPAISVYKQNFNHPIFKRDLSLTQAHNEINNFTPDVIIGGPPCQDFSTAGHRDERLGRANLTLSFGEIIVKCKPQLFVMENVPRIKKSNILFKICNMFKDAGYGITNEVLNSSFYGVPQSRKRLFLIGHLGSPDDFLSDILIKNKAKTPMSIYDYLGDSLGIEYYFRVPRSYERRGVFSIYEPSMTIRAVDRPIPKEYKKHPGDLVEIGEKVRAFSTFERSYIQTFPKNFIFTGTKSYLNQMIGNAVPVKMAEFVGRAIHEYIKTRK